jgi:hypothetical protein
MLRDTACRVYTVIVLNNESRFYPKWVLDALHELC